MTKTKDRLDQTAEYFTPTSLINEIIDNMENNSPDLFSQADNYILDPTAGNGQITMGILNRKVLRGLSKDQAISSTLSVDIMPDNVCDIIARIVFWKDFNIEIFDDKGFPMPKLKFDGHDDAYTVYDLYEDRHSSNLYERVYIYDHIKVTVRQDPYHWWLFQYCNHQSDDKFISGGFNTNIMVADALKYDFLFDGSEPLMFTIDELKEINRTMSDEFAENITKELIEF